MDAEMIDDSSSDEGLFSRNFSEESSESSLTSDEEDVEFVNEVIGLSKIMDLNSVSFHLKFNFQ